MSRLDDLISFDPVYFVKPGDTLEKAARSLLGRSMRPGDVDAVAKELTVLNPRLSRPSHRRMGNLLIPGQILSLTPHEFFPESTNANSVSDRLIQYQSAREEGLRAMDPVLRLQFEQHSTSVDDDWENYFSNIAYVSAKAVMHDLPKFIGPEALWAGHHLGHHYHAKATWKAVNELKALLNESAKAARKGVLDGPLLRSQTDLLLKEIAHSSKWGIETAVTKTRIAARQHMKGVFRLNKSIKAGVVPRLGRQYTNSASAFKPLTKVKWIRGAAVVGLTLEGFERSWAVMGSEHKAAEAAVQLAAFGATAAAGELGIVLVCTMILGAPTAGVSAFLCPLVAGTAGVGIFAGFLEHPFEHAVRASLVHP